MTRAQDVGGDPDGPREVGTWEELRAQVRALLDAINADPALARGAAANPLLALEEIGYRVAPEARSSIEDRFRFSYRTAARLRTLRRELRAIAKRDFDPDSPADLRLLLFDELKLKPSRGSKSEASKRSRAPVIEHPPVRVPWAPPSEDPLEVLRGAHPLLEPLLEYRRLEASAPRLAPPDLYREVREGLRKVPLTRLRGRLKTDPRPTGPDADA